jgi:hypothetical protein
MTYTAFVPSAAKNRKVPALYYLSGYDQLKAFAHSNFAHVGLSQSTDFPSEKNQR